MAASVALAAASLGVGCGSSSSLHLQNDKLAAIHAGKVNGTETPVDQPDHRGNPATGPTEAATANRNTSSDPSLSIYPARRSISSNQSDQLRALFADGSSAELAWSIVDGQNAQSLGQGSISTAGVYTPPPILSADMVSIEVKAALRTNPAVSATYILTVTPGFVDAPSPVNANLTSGGKIEITVKLAELNAGSVNWRLGSELAGPDRRKLSLGSLVSTGCRHSAARYTSCTATYTAPKYLPPDLRSADIAAMPRYGGGQPRIIPILFNQDGFNSSPLSHQKAEAGTVEMGVSGGNANDFDSTRLAGGRQYVDDCCGGTLGALVRDGSGALYILSNNHVLAESDQAHSGDSIVQPALIDSDCNPEAGQPVGTLRYAVPLDAPDTNVDAAVAVAGPAVDPSGSILELGPEQGGSLLPAPPAAGVGEPLIAAVLDQLHGVVKSGRTTGLTCSSINAVDLTVAVNYYYDCAETKPYDTKVYTGQIGVSGANFADSGDSGALLLDRSNAEPIGLIFATGGNRKQGLTVANPIGDVLRELATRTQAGGRTFDIVGGGEHPITCPEFNSQPLPNSYPLSAVQQKSAQAAAALAQAEWMRPGSGILGFGVGSSLDRPGEPAVMVYVRQVGGHSPVPETIRGLRTVVVSTDAAGAAAHVPQASPVPGIHLPAAVLAAAESVVRREAAPLMKNPAIFGVGITQSYDDPSEAALLVLVDSTQAANNLPDILGGLRVRPLVIPRLHATRSRFRSASRPTGCELRAPRISSPALAPTLPLPASREPADVSAGAAGF